MVPVVVPCRHPEDVLSATAPAPKTRGRMRTVDPGSTGDRAPARRAAQPRRSGDQTEFAAAVAAQEALQQVQRSSSGAQAATVAKRGASAASAAQVRAD